MLDIIELYLKRDLPGIRYCRMDGTTNIKDRQRLVDMFNDHAKRSMEASASSSLVDDNMLDLFLLTTKVGGLGVNLTGANRVIIFDPDWNPCTDIQARERAWRLGQSRSVQVYRMMTQGTIEEKIYQRQLFKQFLTQRVLNAPSNSSVGGAAGQPVQSNFMAQDLHDLFTFKEDQVNLDDDKPAIDEIFAGSPNDLTEESMEKRDEMNTINQFSHMFRAEELKESIVQKSGSGEVKDTMLQCILPKGLNSNVSGSAKSDKSGSVSKSAVQPDDATITAEAKRIADKATRVLVQAAELAKSAVPGTVTWTGMQGTYGRHDARQYTNGGRAITHKVCERGENDEVAFSMTREEGELLPIVCDLFAQHGGCLRTHDLLKRVEPLLTSIAVRYDRTGCDASSVKATSKGNASTGAHALKRVLRRIAVLVKPVLPPHTDPTTSKGQGVWKLRDEWRK